jgi:hypothetical protein
MVRAELSERRPFKYDSMWRAGNRSGNFKEISRSSIGFTYIFSSVAFECAVVDLHNGIDSINSSTLEVACTPPENWNEMLSVKELSRNNN